MSYRTLGDTILLEQDAIAEAVMDIQYTRQSELRERYGPVEYQKCLRDIRYHCVYLAAALTVARPALFADYIAWAGPMLASYNVPLGVLQVTLEALRDVVFSRFEPPEQAVLVDYFAAGEAALAHAAEPVASFIIAGAPYSELAEQYLAALLAADRRRASTLILNAIDAGATVKAIYRHVFQPAQYELGRLWQINQISVAQEHYGTAITQLVMSLLYPRIFAAERNGRRLVATCIGGELHEIGVRMVADFFEMAGWDTFYLGANTPPDSIIQTVQKREAEVLAVSATMTMHVSRVADLIAAVRDSTVREVKILTGGYPFNRVPDLWQQVGADGYAPNAEAAIARAEQLLQLYENHSGRAN